MSLKVILSFCLVILSAALSYGKEWHGIVPLHSTRADVERILGPAKEPAKEYVSVHETKNEVVLVEYTTGDRCSGGVNTWQVPRGTVISISVSPRSQLRFADLKLDTSKYKVTDGGHVPNYAYYTSDTEGIKVEVTQGLVMSILYFPGAESDGLRCPLTRNKNGHCYR